MQSCEQCCYGIENKQESEEGFWIGTCYRYPPVITDDDNQRPKVYSDEWCGEWERKGET
jgi:hypothetical protein